VKRDQCRKVLISVPVVHGGRAREGRKRKKH
jgi:hypothetical protein